MQKFPSYGVSGELQSWQNASKVKEKCGIGRGLVWWAGGTVTWKLPYWFLSNRKSQSEKMWTQVLISIIRHTDDISKRKERGYNCWRYLVEYNLLLWPQTPLSWSGGSEGKGGDLEVTFELVKLQSCSQVFHLPKEGRPWSNVVETSLYHLSEGQASCLWSVVVNLLASDLVMVA